MANMDQKEVLDLHASLTSTWQTRNGEYDLARLRVDGEHWDAATNPAPPPDIGYSLTLNYLKPFVDKSVQSLIGRIPGIQVMPMATDEESRRHAESLEGVLYGTWDASDMAKILFKTAYDSFVLRRGIVYLWWDPKAELVRLKNVVPDNFYPEFDGDDMWRAMYVSRRNTARLKSEYPDLAADIVSDSALDFPVNVAESVVRLDAGDQTTIYDIFDVDGYHTRMMGNAIKSRKTGYPFKNLPFVEFPCYPRGGMAEPLNMIDQLVELNQYLDQLVSQKADIIARYANPTILDFQSGQSPEDIRRAVAAHGAVIPVRREGNIALLNWQGTVPAIDEQITLILDTMFDLAGKPRASFGQTITNQSGIATNLSLNPTLQSNESLETTWGQSLSKLNEYILMLWEEFMAGGDISFQGQYFTQVGSSKTFDVSIRGKDIGHWYKNRIKWPSATRTDDPVYVQNHLQQLQAQPFPALSLYTYLEEMGVEDVEAEIDRIGLQLEDPRFHPDRMTAGVDAAVRMQGAQVPAPGLPSGGAVAPPGADQAMMDSAAAAGVPNQGALSSNGG